MEYNIEVNKLIKSIYCNMSLVMRKPVFCISKNKDADQLRGDQLLCFRYTYSTVPLHILLLYSPVCVGPGQKP